MIGMGDIRHAHPRANRLVYLWMRPVVKGAHRENHRYGDRERKEQKQCLLPPVVHLFILCAELQVNSSFPASIETLFRAYGRS